MCKLGEINLYARKNTKLLFKKRLCLLKLFYRLLKKNNLKEMYIIKYADDFKIFCRKRSDAEKAFIAVK